MSAGAIIGIAIAVLVVLAAVAFVTAARRGDKRAATGHLSRETIKRDRGQLPPSEAAPEASSRELERAATLAARPGSIERAAPTVPAPYVPLDPERLGFTRRQFMNRSLVTLMLVSLGGFGASLIAFLWPKKGGGFGSKITIGKLDDVISLIQQNQGFYYVPDARAWITPYPADALPKAREAYKDQPPVLTGMEAGVVALYQKCVHLGCRVPACLSSQWFECPCHGSQYNRVGEKKGGPAPRGLDRFPVTITGGVMSVDTGLIFLGPPIGTNTTGQEAEGPHCVSGGEGGHH